MNKLIFAGLLTTLIVAFVQGSLNKTRRESDISTKLTIATVAKAVDEIKSAMKAVLAVQLKMEAAKNSNGATRRTFNRLIVDCKSSVWEELTNAVNKAAAAAERIKNDANKALGVMRRYSYKEVFKNKDTANAKMNDAATANKAKVRSSGLNERTEFNENVADATNAGVKMDDAKNATEARRSLVSLAYYSLKAWGEAEDKFWNWVFHPHDHHNEYDEDEVVEQEYDGEYGEETGEDYYEDEEEEHAEEEEEKGREYEEDEEEPEEEGDEEEGQEGEQEEGGEEK